MSSGKNRLHFDRRFILKVLLLSGAYSLSGCAKILPNPVPGKCSIKTTDKKLIIDMHCHLMNLLDIDRMAFVSRRYNSQHPEFGLFATLGAWFAALPHYFILKTASYENQWISEKRELLQLDPQTFCDMAANDQIAFTYPKNDKQVSGLFSNRTRNAARMMEIFPEVDIFTPSMVDFYEGTADLYSDPTILAFFYRQLNLASYGRFMPLVSFSPERYYIEDIKSKWSNVPAYPRNFELVKRAIEEWGFVGVKLHPSSGFSPIDNEKHGCPNTPFQRQEELEKPQAEVYDEILMELYTYCRSVDVPLLIHSGTGIPANSACMERSEDPSEWNNAPELWSAMLETVNAPNKAYANTMIPDKRKLRICLAHFAGAFFDYDDHSSGPKELEIKKKNNSRKPTIGAPHPWLLQAAKGAKKHPELYVDLSDVTEWFSDNIDTYEANKEALNSFLIAHPDLAKNMMYGTDWHITAPKGHSYKTSLEGLIPAELYNKTMGLNSAMFYGLTRGSATRKRLNDFYINNGIDLDKIRWMKKIDNLCSDPECNA